VIVLFGLLYAAVILALLIGQFKVVRRAMNSKTAGIGRFTYSQEEAPIGFWVLITLEIVGLMVATLYVAGALGVLLK
jgi:hypothetical protein